MKPRSFANPLLISLISCLVLLAASPIFALAPSYTFIAAQDQNAPPPESPPPPTPDQPQPSQLTPQQSQELVAPIALYPDALVAQILAASAYPTQIVEAERFLEQNPDLKGKDLGDAVDKQDWDPSVKALCQFPSVLADMNKNLSWTSELGDANTNQPADVMNAIQYMRHQAEQAGNLKSTPQQNVTNQGDDVDIAPADPDVVYVPEYNPELVYGYPVAVWPGLYPWWFGIGGPYISFGLGFGIGPFFGFGWGWPAWGFDWFHHGLIYGGHPYIFHSHAFYDRNAYFHSGFRGGFRGGPGGAPFARGDRGLRGFAGPGRGAPAFRGGGAPAGHVGAFGGIARGGDSRGFSARGRSSFGGGGGFHGGGGGGRR